VDADYNLHLCQESNRETDKANSFADDNSTGTVATIEALGALAEIVTNFSVFSGLSSNADKTTLLQIGRIAQLSPEILDLGFNVVQNVTILGMKIDNTLSTLTEYFDEALAKIMRIGEFWERFNLSLPGRIQVCKTFMLAQIGYLGSIITPTGQQLKRLQDYMDKFCLKKLRVAKRKLYLQSDKGGLGLINLDHYITALQCAWIKRVTHHWGDNWRFDLKRKCYGNPLLADEKTFENDVNPILHNLCKSFGKFKNQFSKKDLNYKKALVFKNSMFRRGENSNHILCESFFGQNRPYGHLEIIATLKFEDFFDRNHPKALDELNRQYNVQFSLVTYMRLHEALQYYKNTRRNDNKAPSQSIEFFLKTFVKGSRPFRKILQNSHDTGNELESMNTVTTFFAIIGLEKVEYSILRKIWGTWNFSCFGNKCREFLFKYFNNCLGINARVCKFVRGYEAECSFCIMGREPAPQNAETFAHLFFECPHSGKYRNVLESDFFPEVRNCPVIERKRFWFLGLIPSGDGFEYNSFVSAALLYGNFLIWQLKLSKVLDPVGVFKENFIFGVTNMLKRSKVLRDAKDEANYFICRRRFSG
jgi:hypothetical protein